MCDGAAPVRHHLHHLVTPRCTLRIRSRHSPDRRCTADTVDIGTREAGGSTGTRSVVRRWTNGADVQPVTCAAEWADLTRRGERIVEAIDRTRKRRVSRYDSRVHLRAARLTVESDRVRTGGVPLRCTLHTRCRGCFTLVVKPTEHFSQLDDFVKPAALLAVPSEQAEHANDEGCDAKSPGEQSRHGSPAEENAPCGQGAQTNTPADGPRTVVAPGRHRVQNA
jgi:hypothetical protein